MKVLINALASKAGGGITYLKNLLEYISNNEIGLDITVLLSSVYQGQFVSKEYRNVKKWVVRMPRSAALMVLWEQTILPLLLWKGHYDVIFNPCNFTQLLTPIKDVIVVSNLNIHSIGKMKANNRLPITFKLFCQYILANLSLLKAKWVIYPTRTAYKEVEESVLGKLGDNYSIIPYGVNKEVFSNADNIKDNSKGKEKFTIIYVSNFAEHKNHAKLIDAFLLISQKGIKSQLILIGDINANKAKKKWCRNKIYRDYSSELFRIATEEDIILTGHVENDGLPKYYKMADMFAFPSLRESFGHPIVEAMSCGLPIAISDLPYAHEICGDAAVYFDPLNPKDIADKIIEVLLNDELRESLIRKSLERAKLFSWERCFSETLRVIESVAAK
ncbi:MAG: glycosyltransferase family 4 protein [Actinobacteria bacterium]|nr:glycosyltransferase family 4 protein [Actinomycetota bacterium]